MGYNAEEEEEWEDEEEEDEEDVYELGTELYVRTDLVLGKEYGYKEWTKERNAYAGKRGVVTCSCHGEVKLKFDDGEEKCLCVDMVYERELTKIELWCNATE
jgi:hypothetical protein